LAISRARKEDLVAEYQDQLSRSNGIVIAQYTALSVHQMEALRRLVREQEGQDYVVKNTLFDLVLSQQGYEVPAGLLDGTTLVTFCHQDVPPLAKVLRDYIKEVEEGKLVLKGGLLEGRFLSGTEVTAIADLPSREVLLGQVLGTINAPATRMAGVVASGVRQVLNVIQAYVDKLEEAGGASAEAAA
jgi:large subunit ribosomal protein L10